jgi:hypothetical protein
MKNDKISINLLILLMLPAFLLFSHIAFLFVWFPLYNLFLLSLERKRKVLFFVGYLFSVLSLGFFVYQYDLKVQPIEYYQPFMKDYFISFNSFPDFFENLGEGINNLFSHWFVERPRVIRRIGRVFVFFGFLSLFHSFFVHVKNSSKGSYLINSVNSAALILFVELLVLGVLKLYPFVVVRTALFFCPLVLYLTVKGIVAIEKINKDVYRVVHASYLAFLFFVAVALFLTTLSGNLTARRFLW